MLNNKLIIWTLLLAGCAVFISAQSSIDLSNAKFPTSTEIAHEEKPIIVNDENLEKKKTTTTTSSTTTTTTAEPITTLPPSTPSSTSSSSTTTTSTTPVPPTTPSTTPTTTTTTTTTSTTEPPKTTTTSAPITTTTSKPAPGPYPKPTIGQWNSSCIMIKFAAQLNFTYETKDNKTATALYNIPADAKVEDSHCDGKTVQTIQLNWGPDNAQHSFTLQFDQKNNTAQLSMIQINLPLMSDNFPNVKVNESIQLIHRGADFDTPVKMSYHCTRAQKFNLTETIQDKEIIGTITFSDVQTEAFRAANATGFATVHDCDSSETSDMVPIAVGIALAALIFIVLISYLCARRRSTLRGYMSF